MAEETAFSSTQNNPARNSPLRMAAGFALLAPALVCCAAQLAFPTFQTFVISFQKVNLFSPPAFVGLDNYSALLGNRTFGSALGFTLLTTVVRAFLVAIVPLILALGVNAFGRTGRFAVRVLFTLPIALFMPVTFALGWRVVLSTSQQASGLSSPAGAPALVILIDSLYTFGLACGVGLIFYLAALRGGGPSRNGPPLVVTWVAGLAATIAFSLQSFTLSFLLTRGGPVGATMTLMLLYYQMAFQNFNFGPAAALGVLLVIILAAMGILVGAIVVFTRLRLAMASNDRGTEPFGGRPLAIGLFVIALLLALPACALSVIPIPAIIAGSVAEEGFRRLAESVALGNVATNTVLPVLISVLVQVVVAYLGALGIGGLRPLGKRSELLLLLFSPWLFVSVRPLTAAIFQGIVAAEPLNAFITLIPPLSLSVPMLFILTLFFKGLAANQESDSPFFKARILPSLPLTAFLACAALWVGLQDLWWPLIAANDPQYFTAPAVLMNLGAQFFFGSGPVAAGLLVFSLPSFLFFFVVFSAFQVLYLDRLQLIAGEEETVTPES